MSCFARLISLLRLVVVLSCILMFCIYIQPQSQIGYLKAPFVHKESFIQNQSPIAFLPYLIYNATKRDQEHTQDKEKTRKGIIVAPLKLDGSQKSQTIWPTDPKCSDFNVSFSERGSLPKIGLVSFPGSGNTWLRYLIEAATGVFTGSRYEDLELHKKGYLGERVSPYSGTTLTQKTHDHDEMARRLNNQTAILMIRNPYLAVLSHFNFEKSRNHKEYAAVQWFREDAWPSWVEKQIVEWRDTAVNWIKNTKPQRLLVIHYELLQKNTIQNIKMILGFLGIPEDGKRLNCLKEHLSGNFKRPDQFLPSDLEIYPFKRHMAVDSSIFAVNEALRAAHQQLLPLDMYAHYGGLSEMGAYTLVKCSQDETQRQCDSRIDNLNINRQSIYHANISTTPKSKRMIDILKKLKDLQIEKELISNI